MKHSIEKDTLLEENSKLRREQTRLLKQLEKLNKKLEESEALKSHFLSNIRNEINNPLTSIIGLSESLLSNRKLDGATISEVANSIHAESVNLNFQLENIFAAAELEAGETALTVSNVHIQNLIQSVVHSFAFHVKEKKLSVEILNCNNNQFHFRTDAEKVHLILSNLVANAIEFCDNGTTLQLKVWISNDNLNISVRDNGMGIKKKDLEAIFDRFKQLDSGTLKHHKGHGLGLSVVKALLDVLNGNISITSKVGEGSLFTISIPEANTDLTVDTYANEGNELFFEF